MQSPPTYVALEAEGTVTVRPLGRWTAKMMIDSLAFIGDLDPDVWPNRLWDFSSVTSFPDDETIDAAVAAETTRRAREPEQVEGVSRIKVAFVGDSGRAVHMARRAAQSELGYTHATFGSIEGALAWLHDREDEWFEEIGYGVEVAKRNGYLYARLWGTIDAEAVHDAITRMNAPRYDVCVRRVWDVRAAKFDGDFADIELVAAEVTHFARPDLRLALLVASVDALGVVNSIASVSAMHGTVYEKFFDLESAEAWVLDES